MTGPLPGPVRGVLFDKDGTLFDFQATWGGWARAFVGAESGGDPARAAALADAIGFDAATGRFRESSIVVSATNEVVAEALLPLFPRDSAASLRARIDASAEGMPQVEAAPLRDLLGALRERGLRLGVATNDSEAPARAHLRPVLHLLDLVVAADSGHGSKPGPGPLLRFAEAVGLPPRACVMVGDSLHDLAAARAAGMRAVAVLTGVAGEATLAPLADAVLPSVAALPSWLAGQG